MTTKERLNTNFPIFEVCKTHYETTCETRFKEHEVEQDEPVCTMVTERKCKDVRGNKFSELKKQFQYLAPIGAFCGRIS